MKKILIVGLTSILLLSGMLTVAAVIPPPPDGGPYGCRTPGFWKNHPDAWPVEEIIIGGITYSKDAAIEIMKTPVQGDKTYNMFDHLVAAKLNILQEGCDLIDIMDDIDDADAWMTAHHVGSGVTGDSSAWQQGESIKDILEDYNKGLLCC